MLRELRQVALRAFLQWTFLADTSGLASVSSTPVPG